MPECAQCTSSQAQAVECLQTLSLDTSPCALSNGSQAPAASCANDLSKAGFPAYTSTKATSASSISATGPEEWIKSRRDSLVRIFRRLAVAQASQAHVAGWSPKSFAPSTKSTPASCSSKTARASAPKAAMSLSANSWRADIPGATERLPRLMSAQAISEIAGGCLLPTLTVCGNWNRKGLSKHSGNGLATALKLLPTLCAANAKQGADNRAGAGKKHGVTLPSALNKLPTLCARDYNNSGGKTLTERGKTRLPTAMKHLLPTVCATDYKSPYSAAGYQQQTQQRSKPLRDTLAHTTGHRLTAAFAEWWMGWPLGWTGSSVPVTAKSRSKRQPRGCC